MIFFGRMSRMSKKGLDEMQMQRKNKIGHQAFMMLLYLLMLDAGLYGFGFRWLSYPANIMVILMFCAGIYVVRLITGNAYVGPSEEKQNPLLKTFFTVLVSVSVAAAMLLLVKQADFSNNRHIDEMSAPVLLIAATVALVIAIMTHVIKNIQNKDGPE